MFRPTKKRLKKPRVVLTRDEGDESPDETTVLQPRKQKARPAVMSFNIDEEEATSKKKKKRKGMGFGGAIPQLPLDDEPSSANQEEVAGETPTLYGRDALDKLKAQQRFKRRAEDAVDNVDVTSSTEILPQPPLSEPTDEPMAPPLPSYIPLSHEHTILTGDDALEYEKKQESAPLHSTTEDTILHAEEAEESSLWEAQVANRAGVRTATKPSTVPTTSSTSLTKLRDQVNSTISQLKLQTEDVQSAYARRQAEITQTQEELTRQESELEQAGKALEFYQVVREELASWVGALRELRTKVVPLQEALHKVERVGGNRWSEWQDDMVSILREAGILDRVLGRQPLEEQVPTTTIVDEFGRDVKSQYALQRDKRIRHRRSIRSQRSVRDDDSDALISDGEQAETVERRGALREALKVATEGVEEEYTELSNLIRIFATWARTYPEEYKQCFASLSLADLASILVQVDLCSAHHPLHWQDTKESSELPWIEDLKTIPTGDITEEEDTPTYRMVDKVLIPAFLELLDEGAYDISSSKQTRSLAAFYWRICNIFPSENPMTLQLKGRVVKYLQDGLDNIAIPILTAGARDHSISDDVQEAIHYATSGQVYRIQKFVCNVTHWRILDVAEPMLDFVSSKYLFLLSSLQAQGCTDIASQGFRGIWDALQPTTWLARPELMLQAAPIRAAAAVYDISAN